MNDRPSGPPLAPPLPRRPRPVSRRLRLLVPAVVLLAAFATGPIAPARSGADALPALDPVEAAAISPLAHQDSETGTVAGDTAAGDATAGTTDAGTTDAATGEQVSAADRDVLGRVKQAGLWEMPVGTMASERAVTPRVREVGSMIAAEHQELDRLVTEAAARLEVGLPDQPTYEQSGWIREIDAKRGTEFDQRAVFLLRQAHGKVLPVLAQARAGTRNAVVRQFTAEAMAFVQRHIEYLESTGLVVFEDLPEPSELSGNDWRTHAVDALVFALITALFTALIILAGRTVAGWRKGAATTPRRMAAGRHTRR
jgi:predicted outer membrane protein